MPDHAPSNAPSPQPMSAAELFQRGQAYFDLGQYVDAYPCLKQACAAFEQRSLTGPLDPPALEITQTARCLCLTGRTAMKLAQYPAAREALERSRAIRERLFGLEHPDTAESIGALGELLYELEERQAGLKLTEQAFNIRDHTLGSDHPDTLESLKNMLLERNGFARAQPDLSQAEKNQIATGILTQLRRALATSERIYGDTLPITGRLANALAINTTTSAEDGLRYAAQALDVARKALGASHPETASRLANYALRVADQQPEQAITWTQEALQIHEMSFGLDNLYTGIVQLQLAELLRKAGQTDQARFNYERALIAFEHTVGPKHSLMLRVLDGLILVLRTDHSAFGSSFGGVASEVMTPVTIKRGIEAVQGIVPRNDPLRIKPDPEQAIAALHDFVSRLEAKHRRGEPSTDAKARLQEADRLRDAANAAFERGDYTQAQTLLERALALREAILGSDFDADGQVPLLEKLIATNRYLGRFAAIPSLEARITALQRTAFGPMNPLNVISKHTEWRQASAEGQTDQALAAFQQMQEGMQGFLGKDHPLLEMLNKMNTLQEQRTAQQPRQPKAPLSVRKEQTLASLPPERMTALAGIDQIDWHALRHAYGAADDVPIHLKLLLSDDSDVENSAWAFLYETVLHQGSVYPATIVMVAFLIRMLEQGEPPSRHEILRYILSMLDERFMGEENDDDEPDDLTDEALSNPVVRTDVLEIEAERAIRAGVPIYLSLLHDGITRNADADYMPALAKLLGYFPADASRIVPVLQAVRSQARRRALKREIDRALAALGGSPIDGQS